MTMNSVAIKIFGEIFFIVKYKEDKHLLNFLFIILEEEEKEYS